MRGFWYVRCTSVKLLKKEKNLPGKTNQLTSKASKANTKIHTQKTKKEKKSQPCLELLG